jgi:tetratricopeptide (TPR) repeat protein
MKKIIWIEDYLEAALRLAWQEGHEPALQLLNLLLGDEPGYARLHHTFGIVYYRYADDQRKAEQHFRLAILFDNLLVDSYWHLGKLLADNERWDEALEIYQKGMIAKKRQPFTGADKAHEQKNTMENSLNKPEWN